MRVPTVSAAVSNVRQRISATQERSQLFNLTSVFVWTACLSVGTPFATAQTLFEDDFEGDLSQWVGKQGGQHHGLIVQDPLQKNNHILTFTERNGSGDIFGWEVQVTEGLTYQLEFEYMGNPTSGGNPDNLGGFIGFAEDTPDGHRWLAGTAFNGGAEDAQLIDDGEWHTYSIKFDPYVGGIAYFPPPSNGTIRVMVEDYSGSGGVAGDAFFDNIRLSIAPQACPWDLDNSGSVGTSDLLELFALWGTSGTADFDDDGLVGTSDLLILFANWGSCD